jgi:hypothetical protein
MAVERAEIISDPTATTVFSGVCRNATVWSTRPGIASVGSSLILMTNISTTGSTTVPGCCSAPVATL